MQNKKGIFLGIFGVVIVLAFGVYFRQSRLHPGGNEVNDSTLSLSRSTQNGQPNVGSETPQVAVDLSVDADGLSRSKAVIKTAKGIIKIRFYPQEAPQTVQRIVELIQQGFYNGLTFHRVVPGFVVQGGDPEGTGFGGSGKKLKAEFNTKRRHVEGAVAMARSPRDPDSADSQFYISLGTHIDLDGQYTVFGKVVEGMDIVKKIEQGDAMVTVTIE